jgi:hypothetical protein
MEISWNKTKLFIKKHLKIIKIIFYFSLFLLIYVYSFSKLENSLYRKNASGNIVFSIKPLFTEGFIGPVRMVYLGITKGSREQALKSLIFMLTNSTSPYAVMLLVYIISIIINVIEKYI